MSLSQRVLNDVNNCMECCKTTNPSIYSSEIQTKLVKNNFQCLSENVPSHASMSHSVAQDLGVYSIKKFSVISQAACVIFVMSVQCLFLGSSARISQVCFKVRHFIDNYL